VSSEGENYSKRLFAAFGRLKPELQKVVTQMAEMLVDADSGGDRRRQSASKATADWYVWKTPNNLYYCVRRQKNIHDFDAAREQGRLMGPFTTRLEAENSVREPRVSQ
jgi:hypothetical protein